MSYCRQGSVCVCVCFMLVYSNMTPVFASTLVLGAKQDL